jgi:hypothetical protein
VNQQKHPPPRLHVADLQTNADLVRRRDAFDADMDLERAADVAILAMGKGLVDGSAVAAFVVADDQEGMPDNFDADA